MGMTVQKRLSVGIYWRGEMGPTAIFLTRPIGSTFTFQSTALAAYILYMALVQLFSHHY